MATGWLTALSKPKNVTEALLHTVESGNQTSLVSSKLVFEMDPDKTVIKRGIKEIENVEKKLRSIPILLLNTAADRTQHHQIASSRRRQIGEMEPGNRS